MNDGRHDALREVWHSKDKGSRAAGARPKLVRNRATDKAAMELIGRAWKMGSKGSGTAYGGLRTSDGENSIYFEIGTTDDDESSPSTDGAWCLH